MHIQRIRCHYCNRRVPANVTVCPNCQHDPRGLYLNLRLFLGLAGLVLLGVVVWAAFNAPVWVNALALRSTGTPTPRPTARSVILVVTSTASPNPTAAPTNVVANVQTDTPVSTPTSTPTLTATATRRAVRAAPTRTPTATATLTPLSAPALLSPENGAKFQGSRKTVVLAFQPTEGLSANQWYRVQVDFKDRDDQATSWCGWSKGEAVLFPPDYYGDSYPFDRAFRWHVELVASSSTPPTTCSAPTTSVSAPSAIWVFYWY